MTLIVGWIACDNKGDTKKPSALYFGSDSRYSWGHQHAFNYGKKVYAAKNLPEIFAFCGSVVFANMMLPPLIDLIDSGAFFKSNDPKIKVQNIAEHFSSMVVSYVNDPALNQTVILYGTKIKSRFSVFRFTFQNKAVQFTSVALKDCSSIIAVEGSGVKPFEVRLKLPMLRTDLYSREICHYLAETIEINDEFTVGGIPQIVGLFRGKKEPQVFGFVKDDKSYLYGNEVDAS